MNQNDREYYLDWIRIGVILLLVPFHSALTFTAFGDGFIRYPQSVLALDIGLWFLSIWIMPVLFVVAGVAAYHSLQNRTRRQYTKERRLKLLVPLFTGILLVCPPMAYLRALFMGSFKGNFIQFYPRFFVGGIYPQGDLNWGHLWFLAYLYVFTMILLPIFILIRRERNMGRLVAASTILEKGFWIYIVVIPLMLTETVLRPIFPGLQNLVWDWANFTLYLVLVFYGFLFAINCRILDNIQRIRLGSIILAGSLFITAISLHASKIGIAVSYLFPAYNVLMGFACVFAVLGYAKQYLNQPLRFYDYLKKASFPFYILHFLPITLISYLIAKSSFHVWLKFLMIIVVSYFSTFALYEIIRRMPQQVRFAFGVKKH